MSSESSDVVSAGTDDWGVRPGTWLAVLGRRVTLALPPDAGARAAALWQAVEAGADFDETLDLLLTDGLRALPALVLVGDDAERTRVLVRGAVAATLDDAGTAVRLDGATALTWVEHVVAHAGTPAAIEVHLEGAATGSPNVVAPGSLVRAAWLGRGEVPGDSSGAGSEATSAADSGGAAPVLPDTDPDSDIDPEAALQSAAESEESGAAPPPLEEPTDPPTADVGLVDPLTDPQFAAVPAAPPGGAEHDGMTRAGGESEEFARQQPGIPGQEQAPQVIARPVARLICSHGETVDVDRVVLIGRAPEARRFTSTDQPHLLTVPSPHQEISSTHVEIRPGAGVDHGSAVVTDLGSTNGTVIAQPGLAPEDLQPGIAVQLIPGAIIDLGDGVTIQVTNP